MKHILLCLAFTLGAIFSIEAQAPEVATDISPLLISEQVPSVQVTTMEGNEIDILDVFKEGNAIVLFYRGGWCPYCNAHLSEIGKIEKEILDLGYQVIAISPDSPENLSISADKTEVRYQLYSDGSGKLMSAMGIAFKAPERYGDMLMKYSKDKNMEKVLPVPSLFIVDQEGIIQFEYISPNYKQRLSSNMLLAILKELKAE